MQDFSQDIEMVREWFDVEGLGEAEVSVVRSFMRAILVIESRAGMSADSPDPAIWSNGVSGVLFAAVQLGRSIPVKTETGGRFSRFVFSVLVRMGL